MWAGTSVVRGNDVQDNVAFGVVECRKFGFGFCIVERAELMPVIFGDVARTHTRCGFGEDGFRLGGVVSKVAEAALPLCSVLAEVVQTCGNDDAAVEIRIADDERGFVRETFRGDCGSIGGYGVGV